MNPKLHKNDSYRHRVIETKLREYLQHFPAVGLTGPRQSGKSTLLKHQLKNYQYVTFDDDRMRAQFQDDPIKFMRIYSHHVVFDEVQKVPTIFNAIKIAIDENRNTPGKFVLTGSSQFSLTKRITESLAGRIGLLSLLPFQFSEMPRHLDTQAIFQGGYPELVDRDYALVTDWFSAYLDTYISKDLSEIADIGDKRDFRRLIQLLAANTSQLLNMSHYARDIGVDVKTIRRWVSVLEASYIIFLLPPFYNNLGKRIVKSPKIYFYDTGLVSYLTGIQSQQMFEQGPLKGALFENYVVSEILKRETHNKTHAELFFYRTSNDQEVDLIIDRKQSLEWIEIKSGETFNTKMTKTLESMIGKQDRGYLLYRGAEYPYLKNVQVMNYKDYLSEPIIS